MFKLAILDLLNGFKKYPFWSYMAWQEIVIRYRRSVLGPFWITVSTSIYIIAISTVFSSLFNQNIQHYILYMAIGFLIWGYINQTIIESTDSFIAGAGFIKQIKIERSVFVYQSLARNFYFFLHNSVIIIVCLIFFDSNVTLWSITKAGIGFGILSFNLFFVSLSLACICTRFMDLRQIINSVLQIGFLVTPVMWIPTESMRSKEFLLTYNPIYHFIEFIRWSLLPKDFPTVIAHPSINFIMIFTIVNITLSIIIFAKARKNIAYWV